MKKTVKPLAYCKEDEIHIIERIYGDSETLKYIKIDKMDDKYLVTSPSFIAMIAALVFDIFLFIYAMHTQKILFIFSSLYFAFFGSLPFFNLIFKMIPLKLGSKKWRQVAKIHAAMHMAINAFNEKGSTPTLEEIRQSPYIVDNCQCFSSIGNIICSILYLMFSIFLSNWFIILVIYINIYIFSHLLASGGAFNNLQKLILSKPTNEELNIVLEHLESIDRWDELWNFKTYDADNHK